MVLNMHIVLNDPLKIRMTLTATDDFLSFNVAICSLIDNTDVGGTFVKNREIQAIAITVKIEMSTNGDAIRMHFRVQDQAVLQVQVIH